MDKYTFKLIAGVPNHISTVYPVSSVFVMLLFAPNSFDDKGITIFDSMVPMRNSNSFVINTIIIIVQQDSFNFLLLIE